MTPTAKTPTAMTQEACLTAPPPAASADSDSGLTGAYLNQFTEMVKLIEQLPDTPELIGDLLNWHPTTYQDYFNASAMPGRVSAADVYASLNRCVRQNFEGVVDDLDCKALGAVAVIRRHYKTHGEARPDIMTDICARAGTHLREVLGKANDLVGPVPGTAGNFAQAGSCGSRKLEHNQFVADAAPFKGRVKIKAAAGSNENGGVGFERFLCDYMVPREWKVL